VIEAVAVVVPAHDEEELLPASLAACQAALRPVALALGESAVHLLVVADACADQTAERARQAGASVIEIRARNVGAARAAGFGEALRRTRHINPEAVWLATTDADTIVPPDWLTRQLGHAERGCDAVVGTVTVSDWNTYPAGMQAIFAAHYGQGQGPHRHVHGANLGMTAFAYLAAGGFRDLRTAEDHAFVDALEAAGQEILRTTDVMVLTSARRRARAPHGFSHLLSTLA
jgi:glycosyltransferase involved in cell wall biosynthesis